MEIGRSHRLSNQGSMVDGGLEPFLFFARNCGWRLKCETGICHGEAARSVLSKVWGDVFARFHAVAAKRRSRTRNSYFDLLGQILCAQSPWRQRKWWSCCWHCFSPVWPFLTLITWGFPLGGLLLCLRVVTVNPALITSDDPGQESFIIGGDLTKFSADVDTLLLLVSCQEPEHKFGGDMVHAQFFRQNPFACPITSSHLLSNIVNGPTSILTEELLNSCNSLRSCAASGSPCVFVIVNWCATGLEQSLPLKHLRTTQALVPEGLLNHCEGLRSTFSKTGAKFDTHSLLLSLIHRKNRHRSWTRLQTNACDNCPRPPSYVQLGTLTHMVVLPSTGASRYNCCIDGGTSPENLLYHLVFTRVCNFCLSFAGRKERLFYPALFFTCSIFGSVIFVHIIS